ncbi:hypothetical protein AtEden1_Chr1g0030671 [Arabidopsis thaliana]
MVSIVDFVVENFICNREIYSQRLLILVQRLEWEMLLMWLPKIAHQSMVTKVNKVKAI